MNRTVIILMIFMAFIFSCERCKEKYDESYHWNQIDQYLKYFDDIDNTKKLENDNSTLTFYDDVPDIFPSLHVLEMKGEITHLQLIFPNIQVTGAIKSYWMKRCNEMSEDIIIAQGYPSYNEFPMKGTAPLFLELWFKTSAKEKVKKLIREIESFSESD